MVQKRFIIIILREKYTRTNRLLNIKVKRVQYHRYTSQHHVIQMTEDI